MIVPKVKFSLRAFLVVCVLVSILFGFAGIELRRMRRQEDLVSALDRIGASYEFHRRQVGVEEQEGIVRRTLVRVLGEHRGGQIRTAQFVNVQPSVELLQAIACTPSISEILFVNIEMTHELVDAIEGNHFRYVGLFGVNDNFPVADVIAQCQHVEKISIAGISRLDLDFLRDCPETMKTFKVNKMAVSFQQLFDLLPDSIEILDISYTTGAVEKRLILPENERIRELYAMSSSVVSNPSFIDEIYKFRNLEILDIRETTIQTRPASLPDSVFVITGEQFPTRVVPPQTLPVSP